MQKGEEPSSGSEEKSEESEESEEPQKKFTRFQFESSEEEEEEKRVIKPMKDKRIEAFNVVYKDLKNHVKINDFSALLDDFANLNKELDKSKQLVEKEGIPMIYIKGLVALENAVNDVDKKALSSLQTKSWNALKNKIKKHNKDYEDKIKEYRAKPVKSDKEEEEKEEGKEEEEEEEEEEESSEEEEVGSEKESSGEEEEETQDRTKMTPAERRKKV